MGKELHHSGRDKLIKKDRRSIWLILQTEQRRAGDLVAMQQPHCCCLDLCQIWVRLAMETECPSDLCRPRRMMEGVKGGGNEGGRQGGGKRKS